MDCDHLLKLPFWIDYVLGKTKGKQQKIHATKHFHPNFELVGYATVNVHYMKSSVAKWLLTLFAEKSCSYWWKEAVGMYINSNTS